MSSTPFYSWDVLGQNDYDVIGVNVFICQKVFEFGAPKTTSKFFGAMEEQ